MQQAAAQHESAQVALLVSLWNAMTSGDDSPLPNRIATYPVQQCAHPASQQDGHVSYAAVFSSAGLSRSVGRLQA